MCKREFLITVAFIYLCVSVLSAAEIVYVDVGSPNDPGNGTSEDPFRRIQNGIDDAISGDTVIILPGIYTGGGNYNLDPNGKSITISSTNPEDAEVVANTIIDPNRAGRGFNIHSGEDANCVISGLTIRNGYTNDFGAGISCQQSSPTIANCSITDNNAVKDGGGLFGLYSNFILINCTIKRNYAKDGGGISILAGQPTMINCIISNNHATMYGGGVDCYFQGNPQITNCSLINNNTEVDGGGAIALWTSDVNLKNSILWANQSPVGNQVYLHFSSSISISYCDIDGGISDVCAPDCNVNWGSGNIDSDPFFATFDAEGDPNLWDFHLQSTSGRWNSGDSEWVIDANLSPCIDAGDPNSDWTAEPWPNGKRINMGAYGGTEQASKSGNIADLNIDGSVNFFDLTELGNLWGESQEAIEDLDKNGTMGIGDLDIMAENWLWEKQQ